MRTVLTGGFRVLVTPAVSPSSVFWLFLACSSERAMSSQK